MKMGDFQGYSQEKRYVIKFKYESKKFLSVYVWAVGCSAI